MNRKQRKREMTRKEALNVLFDLKEAYTDVLIKQGYQCYQDTETFRDKVHNALYILSEAVYGACRYPQLPWPCEVCRHRLSEGHVQEKGTEFHLIWCCTACRDRLQAEGKIVEEQAEETPVEHAPGELQPLVPVEDRRLQLVVIPQHLQERKHVYEITETATRT